MTTAGASSPLRTLYLGELRMLLRDRRTLFLSVILPLIFLPLVFWISSMVEKKRTERVEKETFEYAIVGERADLVRELLSAAPANEATLEASSRESNEPQLELLETDLDCTEAECWKAALGRRDLHVVIHALRSEGAASETTGAESDRPLPRLRIFYQGNWDYSKTAADELRDRLRSARDTRRGELLAEAGFPVAPKDLAPVIEARDLATAAQRGGKVLGRFAVCVLLMFLISGGSVVAADTLAGEKERGTLETLLTSAASRGEIVSAKLLLIVTIGLFIALIQILNLGVYVGLRLIDIPDTMAVEISLLSAFWLVLLLVPLAVIVASALLLVSGRSQSYKDFSVRFFPVLVLLVVPSLVSVLPAVDLRSGIVLVPIANLAVAVREVLVGEIDWLFLGLTTLVAGGTSWVLVRWTLDSLDTERLVTATDVDEAAFLGGEGLFRRHVPVWFGVFWVLIFLANAQGELLPSIRLQIFFNVILVMGAGSFLIIRRYGLDARKVLALRKPNPWVWPAVILGAPSMLLASVGVARISNQLFPVPERMIEAFARQIMPGEMALFEMLLLLALVPGIFEEICFRGALLHGLRKRFHPVVLCLVTGLIFGLFHFSLFRILPTAFLGVVLAAVTLLSGSILPAMLWHALNNATAMFLGRAGVDLTELDPAFHALGAGAAILAFGLLWRVRMPYPDLRSTPVGQRGQR